jgi:E2/UBC family protein E/multiubiquitin
MAWSTFSDRGDQDPPGQAEQKEQQMDSAIDLVDLEEYAKSGKKPPKAKAYRIKIDKVKYTVHQSVITGRELLALAGKTPDKFKIYQQMHGGGQPQQIEPDRKVDLTTPGVEKFKTLPMDAIDGDSRSDARRQFEMSETDEMFLDSLGLRWEALLIGAERWIVVYDFPIPDGYNVRKADLAVFIAPGYPNAQLDMAYFEPHLSRPGRNINGLSLRAIGERNFQQWSRHRTGTSAWRPGEDDLGTQVLYIENFLQAELKR